MGTLWHDHKYKSSKECVSLGATQDTRQAARDWCSRILIPKKPGHLVRQYSVLPLADHTAASLDLDPSHPSSCKAANLRHLTSALHQTLTITDNSLTSLHQLLQLPSAFRRTPDAHIHTVSDSPEKFKLVPQISDPWNPILCPSAYEPHREPSIRARLARRHRGCGKSRTLPPVADVALPLHHVHLRIAVAHLQDLAVCRGGEEQEPGVVPQQPQEWLPCRT